MQMYWTQAVAASNIGRSKQMRKTQRGGTANYKGGFELNNHLDMHASYRKRDKQGHAT